jgi:dihydrofolate reductase
LKPLKAIAAMSLNRVIGRGNQIPWHLPEDFKWFKKTTTGHIIVMGRKTFESIGRPLPHRQTIIISRTGFAHPGALTLSSLQDLAQFDQDSRDIYICGGAQIYEQALPLCSDLYLTVVNKEVSGETFFPLFESHFQRVQTLEENPDFKILHYSAK